MVCKFIVGSSASLSRRRYFRIEARDRLQHLIVLGILLAYCFSYVLDHQEDLFIYLKAANSIRGQINPYSQYEATYVYGPLLAILLSLLSTTEVMIVKGIWFAINSLGLFVIIFMIGKLRNVKGFTPLNTGLLGIILVSSFTFRNNLGQGQVVTSLVALTLTCIYLLLSRPRCIKLLLLVSILIVPILEIKPYLALGIFSYFIFKKEVRLLIMFCAVLLILNSLYFLISDITYLDWFKALLLRSDTVDSGYDQASLQAVLVNTFGINEPIRSIIVALFYVCLLAVLSIKRKSLFGKKYIEGSVLLLPCLFTPFLHSHDILISLVGILLILEPKVLGKFSALMTLSGLFILHVGWTSSAVFVGLVIQALLMFGIMVTYPVRFLAKSYFLLLAFSYTLMLLMYFRYNEDYFKIYLYNLGSLASLMLYFILFVLNAGQTERDRGPKWSMGIGRTLAP